MYKDIGTKKALSGSGRNRTGSKTGLAKFGGAATGAMKAETPIGFQVSGKADVQATPLRKAAGKCETAVGSGLQDVGEKSNERADARHFPDTGVLRLCQLRRY